MWKICDKRGEESKGTELIIGIQNLKSLQLIILKHKVLIMFVVKQYLSKLIKIKIFQSIENSKRRIFKY